MTNRYLWHLTLDTGHGRRSPRDEVDDTIVTMVGQSIAEMLAGQTVTIMPGYTLTGATAGGALVATVTSASAGPIVSIAVAETSLQSAKLWSILARDGTMPSAKPPGPPWCAVRLYPGLSADPGASEWLGDFERCLAWAWLERAR